MVSIPNSLTPRRPTRRRRGFALIEVLVGGILLAIGLTAILVISSRALDMQQRGERDVIAATLLDELLSTVLTEGPADFPDLHQLSGRCDPPFGDYEYAVEIDEGGLGVPYRILATIIHERGQRWSCETYIAAKLMNEDEEEPPRAPTEPLDREARYIEEEERLEGNLSR